MIAAVCDQLIASSACLGTVRGLELFASHVDQISGQLLLSAQFGRAELNELKRCLTIAGDTICCLRNAVTLQLQALGMEKNNAG
ncbi:MAG: hypothetical protein JO189_13795 [Deltaproteobacteria bacterium]|nr:hypothetical protein [Deltaproteobacteria bacterium]